MTQIDAMRVLVEQCSRGDAGAFKQLYETLVGRVFGYLASRTNHTTATDLTQDCFVELYKSLPSFTYRSEPEFHSFVFVIVKRMLAKHYDGKHTKASKEGTELDEDTIAATSEDTVTTISIQQALATLDEVTREIIVLHHWSRYSFSEIAVILNMSEAAARTRHHRALTKLSTHLTSA